MITIMGVIMPMQPFPTSELQPWHLLTSSAWPGRAASSGTIGSTRPCVAARPNVCRVRCVAEFVLDCRVCTPSKSGSISGIDCSVWTNFCATGDRCKVSWKISSGVPESNGSGVAPGAGIVPRSRKAFSQHRHSPIPHRGRCGECMPYQICNPRCLMIKRLNIVLYMNISV